MKIKDLEGKEIEILQPRISLVQLEIFLQLLDNGENCKGLDPGIITYWRDLHQKLKDAVSAQ